MRVACLRLCDAPLTALARREPGLLESAVAVVNAAGAHGYVLAVTPRARTLGVSVGQSVHQARATAPGLTMRLADAAAIASARAALFDAAAMLSPRVEPDGDRVYVDVDAMPRAYGSETAIATALGEAARRVGLKVSVGIASNKGVARVAASRYVGGQVVPPGAESAFLSPLPLDALPLSTALRIELTRLGVRRVGELAALPLEATGTRLGPEGARAVALARGEDPTPLFPRPHATRFEEALDLEWQVCEIGSLAFVVKRLADALVARLACRALAASSVALTLILASRARDERALALAAPTRDVSTLVHLARASLEARPPPDAVVGARLEAVAAAPRPAQLGLFDPPAPAPEAFALTLARLAALAGEGRVGAPHVPNTHRPYAAETVPFVPAPPGSFGAPRTTGVEAPAVALHVFRPPRPASVLVENGRMAFVRAGDIAGAVRVCCGPYRVRGEWWGECFDHEGYDVELSDGGIYLVAFDHVQGAWRIDGVYD